MAIKLSSFNKDFTFGEVDFVKPASKEDTEQGIDAWLGGIPFAWRRRRISFHQYGELSIRYSRASGYKTEYDKLLDGSFKALVYIFQFTDATVVCLTSDIVDCLRKGTFIQRSNHDNATVALYFKVEDIRHLMIKSE